MDTLPKEIIIKQLLLLSHKDLINTCSTNTYLRTICNENKEYIYKNLVKKDFFNNINYEFLYNLFSHEKKRNYESIFNKSYHYELITENLEWVERYIKLGLNIDAESDVGWTPLMFALEYSTPEITNRILDLNPNIDAKNAFNDTPLSFALQSSTQQIINRILDLNPDVNTKNNDGVTPLMFAAQYSTQEIVQRIHKMINITITV